MRVSGILYPRPQRLRNEGPNNGNYNYVKTFYRENVKAERLLVNSLLVTFLRLKYNVKTQGQDRNAHAKLRNRSSSQHGVILILSNKAKSDDTRRGLKKLTFDNYHHVRMLILVMTPMMDLKGGFIVG